MPSILTAEQVQQAIAAHQSKSHREKRDDQLLRDQLEYYGDLRDDVMTLVKNSGMSYETIHGRCGPHPKTLEKWANKEVTQPRLGKLRATLRIIGYDLGITGRIQH